MDIFLRRATAEDVDLLYQWANDMLTRKNSFSDEEIQYENHIEWYEKVLRDENIYQYIMMKGEVPVGQIRLNVEDGVAKISYSIAPEFRGLGYGKTICKLIILQIKREHLKVTKLVAQVKADNLLSAKCFLHNNFQEKFVQYEYEFLE